MGLPSENARRDLRYPRRTEPPRGTSAKPRTTNAREAAPMSEQGQDPRDVVAALLSDPRMQEACNAHDLQTVLRLLRSRGVSMRRVAALIDLSPGRLHEYLKGDRRPSGFDLFERVS